MNTAAQVTAQINGWKSEGLSKAEIVTRTAEACMGWSYVWGAAGQSCTPAYRRQYANRSSCPEGESKLILSKCQVCSGKKSACSGCKWYPGGVTKVFDCRGFTRWVLAQAGISLQGAGATSQWNTAANWTQKGDIKDIPLDQVCCVFWKDKNNAKVMNHTGLHVGGGLIIHCSGEVKRGSVTDKGWTHYALVKGMDGTVPEPGKPTLRRGSKGEYVTLLQTMLIQRGYKLPKYGADGSFGAETEAAVKLFQQDWDLTVDGVVGATTWERLENSPPRETFYSVTIHGLDYTQAKAIQANYPGSDLREE